MQRQEYQQSQESPRDQLPVSHPTRLTPPLSAGASVATWEATVQRWLGIVQRVNTPNSTLLASLARTTNYPELYWGMRDLGYAARREALGFWNHHYGHHALPDPHSDIPYYSMRRIVDGAARWLGVTPVVATDRLRDLYLHETGQTERDVANRRVPLLAWIRVFADARYARQPLLILEPAEAFSAEQRLLEAAAVLGVYWKDHDLFVSNPANCLIWLPDARQDKLVTPLAHSFARGLLHLPARCPALAPAGAGCYCAEIEGFLNTAPHEHPVATDILRPLPQQMAQPPQVTPATLRPQPLTAPLSPTGTTGPARPGDDSQDGAPGAMARIYRSGSPIPIRPLTGDPRAQRR